MKKVPKYSLWYLYYKLVKQGGSPDSVARGVAIGLFIGFLVPIGVQMAIAFPLAVLFKAKKIPALACTWVTNYFTVPFIYPVQCYIGSLIIMSPLSFSHIKATFDKFFHQCANANGWMESIALSVKALLALGMEILVPFLVGGAVLGIIFGVLGYFAAYGMIIDYQQRKKRRLNKRLAEAAKRQAE